MDIWTDESTDGRKDQWADQRKDGWTDGLTKRQTDYQTDGQQNYVGTFSVSHSIRGKKWAKLRYLQNFTNLF